MQFFDWLGKQNVWIQTVVGAVIGLVIAALLLFGLGWLAWWLMVG